MQRSARLSLFFLSAAFLVGSALWHITVSAADTNAYFNSLVARPDHFKSNSLRSQALIDGVSQGKPNKWVTYDAAMDAAKSVIPAFVSFNDLSYRLANVALGAPLTETADRVVFAAPLTIDQKNGFISNRGLLVGNEIMTVNQAGAVGVQFPDDSSVLVKRGQFGTAAVAHDAGATVQISQNSLLNQVRVPLGTSDGHTYLFTWDIRYDRSYLGTDLHVGALGHKEFQFAGRNIWLELREGRAARDAFGPLTIDLTRYVGVIDARHYDNTLVTSPGSNMTSIDPVKPQLNRFFLKPDIWTRFWVVIDQQTTEFARFSMWVADEQTAAVQIFDNLTIRVPGSPRSFQSWWLEQNTSQDVYRGARRDLVTHTRNFVSLVDPGNISSLLLQPLPGGVALPAPPSNLRIIR